jgi:hypothetical protein
VREVIFPTAHSDIDDDGVTVPYTQESIAMIKCVLASLREHLPRARVSANLPAWITESHVSSELADEGADLYAVQALRNDIYRYLQRAIFTESDPRDSEPLQWWKATAGELPCLAGFARRYLAVPAAAGKCERMISAASALASSRRVVELGAGRVNGAVIVRDYYARITQHERTSLGDDTVDAGDQLESMLKDGLLSVDSDGYIDVVAGDSGGSGPRANSKRQAK